MTFQNPFVPSPHTIAGVPATPSRRASSNLYPGQRLLQREGRVRAEEPKVLDEPDYRFECPARGSQQDDSLIPSAIEPLAGGTINAVLTA